MTELTFPQHGDLPDASYWAFAAGTPPTSCIVSGLALTPDYAVPDVDVAGGKAVINRGEMDTADPRIDPPESLQDSVAVVQVESQTVALDDGATNHLWLQANVASDDSPQVVANTTGTAPTTASVKIGEVDTAADTASGQWRLVAPDGTLTFPSKTAASAATGELADGTVVYDRDGDEHYGIVAGSLKGMVGFSDPDGDGTYTLPPGADGAEVDTLSAGGADTATDWCYEVMGGTVANGDAGPVWSTTLADGETLEVTQAMLLTAALGAVPSGVDLVIADLTNGVSETTLITGDGTIQDDETGDPLGSYQNNSGGTERVAILMDNGHFNSGSGSSQDLIGSFIGRVVA